MSDLIIKKYLNISNISLIIKKEDDKLDIIHNYVIHLSIEACIRSYKIHCIIGDVKDYYLLNLDGLSLDYHLMITHLKRFNETNKFKIILICHFLPRILIYQLVDFIIEYIDSKPSIIKNRYSPIYDQTFL